MRTSKLLYLFAGAVLILFSVLSCKDNFSEEDFLRLQAELANKKDSINAAQQNQAAEDAGLLLSWTIQVQENRKPVEGARVVVKTSGTDSTKTLTATTDADGFVTFSNVMIGREIVRISKSGYLTANLAVEFDKNEVVYNGTGDTPIRRTESSIIPIFSVSSTETATISGTATVDTDLTNKTRELVPQGTKIKANIAQALQQANLIYPENSDPSLNQTQRILSYAVEGGENVGVATVDASGKFTMMVPALSEGTAVTLIYDNFEAPVHQAVMWDENTGNPVTPAYSDIDRFFGPDYTGNAAPVQWVPGALAIFPDPPAMASGFAVNNFVARPRDLGSWLSNVTFDQKFTQDDISYWVKSIGSKLSKSPTVTISGGGGSGATMEAWLKGYVTGITVTDRGSGFTPAATFSLEIDWTDSNDALQYINSFDVVIGSDGKLPTQIDLPASGDNGTYGLTIGNPFSTTIAKNFTFRLFDETATDVTSQAGIDVSVDASLGTLYLSDGGNGYTSAPSIAFSKGGSGSTLPKVQVMSFATAYSFDLDNSGNNGNYVLPPEINITLSTATTTGVNNLIDVSGGTLNYTDNINNLITTNTNGKVAYIDPTLTYITQRSTSVPTATVTDFESKPPLADVVIGTDGKVTGLNIANLGAETGSGYTSKFGVTIQNTISTAPGSGAVISLSDFLISGSGEYQWGGLYNVVSGGSGYLQQLNYPFDDIYYQLIKGNVTIGLTDGADGNFPSSITVYPGNTYSLDVYYGTGAVPDVNQLYPGFVSG